MARDKGTHWVVTANRTADGSPVYLLSSGEWGVSLTEAKTTVSDDEKDALLTSASRQERVVCDAYAFRVVLDEGRALPTTARERIRSRGPTTPLRRAD